MNKYLRLFLIWFGIAIALSFIFVGKTVIIGEQLCVDGNNNINLEGMMCEESEYQIYGLSRKLSILVILSQTTTGLIIYGFALQKKNG